MSIEKKKNSSLLLTIFITVFIDMLGVGIIIPVIPAIFFEEGSQFFNGQYSKDQISLFYGILLQRIGLVILHLLQE